MNRSPSPPDNFFFHQGASAGYVWAWSVPWQQWMPFPFQGHAWPGDDGLYWFLFGVVNCYGCNL